MKAVANKITLLLPAILLCAPLAPSTAEERLLDAEQCVSLTGIDRTRVVDESNILFYMKNGEIYLNRLPYRCAGLRPRETFMYRTSLNQLCNVDIITVLQNIGFGVTPGASCGLGMFRPIDAPTAEELLRGESR